MKKIFNILILCATSIGYVSCAPVVYTRSHQPAVYYRSSTTYPCYDRTYTTHTYRYPSSYNTSSYYYQRNNIGTLTYRSYNSY